MDTDKDTYIKDYDRWNTQKKLVDKRVLPDDFFFLDREVWWTSLGVNIGKEIDGKNHEYERPILVFRKVSQDTLWALPITSTIQEGDEFHPVSYKEGQGIVLLGQIRFISASRLIRLAGRIDEDNFRIIKEKFARLVQKQEIPR
jgi:mRNA-degrading endonuclease toxin of MazEF toxin-antitoxin module